MIIIKTFILNGVEWRETSCEGFYVTKFGDVSKMKFCDNILKSFFLMKQEVTKSGHLRVEVNRGSHRLTHRLVYETWKEPLIDELVIDHIDANPANNNIENLRQVTQKENIQNAILNGNFGKSGIRPITVFNKETKEEKEYESVSSFFKDINVPLYMINNGGLGVLKKRTEYKKYVVKRI